jgi:hypothetical protein
MISKMREKVMKRLSICIFAAIVILVTVYFIITRNGMPRISINNVKSVSIRNRGLVLVKQLNIENNKDEINNLISMYNKARRTYRHGDTTPSVLITFELNDGEKISIHGNTQSYQYVSVNGKNYKIYGKELTQYIRNLSKVE